MIFIRVRLNFVFTGDIFVRLHLTPIRTRHGSQWRSSLVPQQPAVELFSFDYF